MKKYLAVAAAGVIALGAIVSCSLFGSLSGDMPSKIGFTIPSSLYYATTKVSAPSDTNGPAYLTLKSYVTAGKEAADTIDTVLSNVYTYKDLFMATAGSVYTLDNGNWVLFVKSADAAYYLYYGTSASTTNIYMDWTEIGTGTFSGKILLFMNGTSADIDKALVYFDTSLAQPYLDIYVDPTAASKYTQLRVKLTELAEGEVQAQARVLLTNQVFPLGWNESGYGSSTSDGAGYGYASGEKVTGNYHYTNYIYREEFGASGTTIWKLATYDVFTNNNVQIETNTYYIPDSYTNAPATMVTNTVANIPLLTDAAFPSITLP